MVGLGRERLATWAESMPVLKSLNVLLLVFVCVTLAGACAPAEDAGPVEASPPAESAVEAESETPAAVEVAEPEVDPLVGSTWAIADYTVTFEADGVVRFNSGSEGTWSRAEDTITISVAGEETVIQVDGDTLTHNGMALEQQ